MQQYIRAIIQCQNYGDEYTAPFTRSQLKLSFWVSGTLSDIKDCTVWYWGMQMEGIFLNLFRTNSSRNRNSDNSIAGKLELQGLVIMVINH